MSLNTTTKLREVRQRHKMPVVTLAVRSGVSPATCFRCDAYGYTPSMATARKIAKTLHAPVLELFPQLRVML